VNTAADNQPWLGRPNPFPTAAVARVSDLYLDVPTIATPAVLKVRAQVDAYLGAARGVDEAVEARPRDASQLADTGTVIVISGDYGTGKTHLAMEALAYVERSRSTGRTETKSIYQVAPGGPFLALYMNLMEKNISRQEVRARVLDFYAGIVAATLRGRAFTDDLVQAVEIGDADPQFVVEQFGLSEGALLRELRRQLSVVTGDEAFGSVLVFLLRPELEDSAWRWLCGKSLDPILAERGITGSIATDKSALEALGVLALLHGRQNHRFVLIIDEMEKVILTWERSPEESIQAFKQLFEVFRAAGALLVSCGLPDIFEVIPKDPGRIDAVVAPSQLTVSNVRWYIEETQERVLERRALAPFNDESVNYLVYLSRGIAREVVKLCYHAYERAAATGSEITAAMIREIARAQSGAGSSEVVRSEIERLLRESGWKVDSNKTLTTSADSRADFWIEAGSAGAGCAVIIADVVLQQEEAAQLVARAATIRATQPHREVLLVVGGYLADDLRRSLIAAYGSSPIIFDSWRFDSSFHDSLNAAVNRISADSHWVSHDDAHASAPTELDDVRTLHEQAERIRRQQTETQRLVRELADRVDAERVSSDERFAGIKRALEAVPMLAAPVGPPPVHPGRKLPEAIERQFRFALTTLAFYGDTEALLEQVFASSARMPGAGTRLSLSYRLRSSESFASIGVAHFLNALISAFRNWVCQWVDSISIGVAPTSIERERLREICRTYETLYGVTPLFQLDPLLDLASSGDDRSGTPTRSGHATRRANLREAFDGLGDRVYQTAIDLANGVTEPPSRLAN